jgi:surfeit locus 1 family protein
VPIVRLPLGGRLFAPSWRWTLLTIVLCAGFVHAGRWQWEKGEQRQAEWDAFARGADRALPLARADVARLPRFQRVALSGEYDAAHQFLLDNRTHAGKAGYEVLTPLALEGGGVVLVDRGWVAFTGYRSRLPQVTLDAHGTVRLTGRLDFLPVAGLALGRVPPDPASPWPKLTSYPQMSDLERAYGRSLEPRIVLLDAAAPFGYVRQWQPPGLPPLRHFSYAAQWWLFAVTLAVIWAVLSTPRRRPTSGTRESSPADQAT